MVAVGGTQLVDKCFLQ